MAAPSENQTPSSGKFSFENVCYRYMPVAGASSCLLFSTNIMNPSVFARLFAPHELVVTNGLWFNAHLGFGLYLFSRKHMQKAPLYYRTMYSVFGAMIFNFGSVLFWATTKTLLPEKDTLRTLFGLGSGVALIVIGKEYMDFVDSSIQNEQD